MTLKRKFELSVCIALIISICFSMVSFARTSEKVRDDVLRLHVIANSDTKEDQNLKLKVRDAVLRVGADIFDGSVDMENAVAKITPQLEKLKETAERVIRENGFDYSVKVMLSREYFTTRTYDTVTLPAGIYLALRVLIGEGAGHNWWCVMFPPMCLPAADKTDKIEEVLNYEEATLVEKNPKYEVRFKVLELYEELKMKINENRSR